MKRWSVLIVVTFVAALMIVPARAQLRPLGDQELAGIKGQGQFALLASDPIGLNLSLDRLSYYDDDGVGPGFQGGYISFCGVRMQGSMSWTTPIGIFLGLFTPILGSAPVSGMDISFDGLTVRIDHLAIDAVRVGNEPGSGLSFGSIAMENFLMQISGRIQVYGH